MNEETKNLQDMTKEELISIIESQAAIAARSSAILAGLQKGLSAVVKGLHVASESVMSLNAPEEQVP